MDQTQEDQAVVAQVLGGDVNAFEALFTKYRGHVTAIVRRHVPGDRVAENVQDTFVRAFQSLDGYRADAAHPPVDSHALMRRLLQLGDSGTAASTGAFLDRLFWRLVLAASALIVVLILVAAGLDFAPDLAWPLFSYENEAADMVQNLLL